MQNRTVLNQTDFLSGQYCPWTDKSLAWRRTKFFAGLLREIHHAANSKQTVSLLKAVQLQMKGLTYTVPECAFTSMINYSVNRFIPSVNSFHPALKYTWEISETSLAFLDIKVSISGNGLCTSVHYKPTDSHSYLLHSSSHPSHVKNSIPYSQFLRLRRLCSDDSDFSNKSKEMCTFFEKRGYPASVIQAAHHRAQQIDRQSALQTSQKEKNDRIPFTLTFHPRNNPVKAIILNNLKILQTDPETGAIFSQPPLISFESDKNVGTFLVRSAFKTIEKPGTFKCARSRCKTCPFVQNADKISGPKRSVKITDRFTCTSANVIYCITCTFMQKAIHWRNRKTIRRPIPRTPTRR